MNKLFVFGLGYTAKRLAEDLMADGWQVAGTCRDQFGQRDLRAAGIEAYLLDDETPVEDLVKAFDGVTHVLDSIPPSEAGDAALVHHGADLAAMAGGLKWVGYLSTTGVYGDTDGEWVDETSPLAPTLKRGERRVIAEQGWQQLHKDHGLPIHIFRLPGIYGLGRSVLDKIQKRQAKRLYKPGHLFGRIHVDDIVATLRASMAKPVPGAIYNVVDDEPVEPTTVTEFGCQLMGMDLPPLEPFEAAAMSKMAASFWAENRKVRNDKIKAELGIKLKYPTYREGLTAIWDQMRA